LLVGVAIAYPVFCLLARPSGQPSGRYLGDLCGAEAVLLFSCTLVLTTLLPGIERRAAFAGSNSAAAERFRMISAIVRRTHRRRIDSLRRPYAA